MPARYKEGDLVIMNHDSTAWSWMGPNVNPASDVSDGGIGTVIKSRRKERAIHVNENTTELKIIEVVEVLWSNGIYQHLLAEQLSIKKNNNNE